MKNNLKKKKGFTLVELIIVVAVLGVLAAIAVPRFGNVQKSAKVSAEAANVKILNDTATMVVAQDKVVLPTGSTQKDISTEVTNELNGNFPAPADSTKKFVVTVNKDGKVTVTIANK